MNIGPPPLGQAPECGSVKSWSAFHTSWRLSSASDLGGEGVPQRGHLQALLDRHSWSSGSNQLGAIGSAGSRAASTKAWVHSTHVGVGSTGFGATSTDFGSGSTSHLFDRFAGGFDPLWSGVGPIEGEPSPMRGSAAHCAARFAKLGVGLSEFGADRPKAGSWKLPTSSLNDLGAGRRIQRRGDVRYAFESTACSTFVLWRASQLESFCCSGASWAKLFDLRFRWDRLGRTECSGRSEHWPELRQCPEISRVFDNTRDLEDDGAPTIAMSPKLSESPEVFLRIQKCHNSAATPKPAMTTTPSAPL